jgi:hypothetical protein
LVVRGRDCDERVAERSERFDQLRFATPDEFAFHDRRFVPAIEDCLLALRSVRASAHV